MTLVESMKDKKKRKKQKLVKWLKSTDTSEVKRNANGHILPVKQHYKKLPKETPPDRDSKLFEYDEGLE